MSTLNTREVLTNAGEPVTIVTDPDHPCWVRVELDGLALEWTTDTDADTGEDLADLTLAHGAAWTALYQEVGRMKLGQSVRQALAVAYALRRGLTVTQAWDHLALEYSLEDVGATEGPFLARDVEKAREEAWAILAAQLRTYGWVRHGDTLGAAQDAAATRVLDLMTGETWEVQTHTVSRQAKLAELQDGAEVEIREKRQAWTDRNGVVLWDASAQNYRGEWWCGHGGVDALPFNPWEMERVQMV